MIASKINSDKKYWSDWFRGCIFHKLHNSYLSLSVNKFPFTSRGNKPIWMIFLKFQVTESIARINPLWKSLRWNPLLSFSKLLFALHFSESFNMDVQAFVQHQDRESKPFFTDNQEVNDLVRNFNASGQDSFKTTDVSNI